MKKTAVALVVVLLLFTQAAFAATDKSHQLAEELLILNNVKAQIDVMYVQMNQMLMGQVDSANVPAEKHQELKDITTSILFENMSWEKMKGEYIELYASTFTEDELAGIIEFSKSPLGKKLALKTPTLVQKSMMIGQQRAQSVIPRVQTAIQEYAEESHQQ